MPPCDEDPDEIRGYALAYIEQTRWTFAKSVPDNPHWYTVRPKGGDKGHEALFRLIQRDGWNRVWRYGTWRTLRIGEWDYWIEGDWYPRAGLLINRKHPGVDEVTQPDEEPPEPTGGLRA